MMLRFATICLVSCVFLSLICPAHLQECQEEEVITVNDHDDVILESGSYDFKYKAFIHLRSTARYTTLAYVKIRLGDMYDKRLYYPDISADVHLEAPGHIQNITITIRDVQESDSGEYNLYEDRQRVTLNCWTLYVLGPANTGRSDEFIETGTSLYITEFPHLSQDVVERMNVMTSWHLDGHLITPQHLSVQHDMNNKNLTYEIRKPTRTTSFVNFSLHVGYTENIVLLPDQTMYVLTYKDRIPVIRCTADCNPICEFAWSKDERVLTTFSTLSPDLLPQDTTGEYTCQAINTATQKLLRKSVYIYKPDTASITFEPEQTFYVLNVGDKIPAIHCLVDCDPACEIYWRHGERTLSESNVLTPESVPKDSSGEFICRASNSVTKKELKRSLYIFYQGKDVSGIVYALVGFVVAFTLLGAIVPIVLYCRRRYSQMICSVLNKSTSRDMEMEEHNAVTDTERPPESYQDLQFTGAQQNMYNDMTTDENPTVNPTTETYENMVL